MTASLWWRSSGPGIRVKRIADARCSDSRLRDGRAYSRLEVGHGLAREALLRERSSGTGTASQSAPAKHSFKDIGVTELELGNES